MNYTVKSGDRIRSLAPAFGVSVESILSANPFLRDRPISLESLPTIRPGDVLFLPVNGLPPLPEEGPSRVVRPVVDHRPADTGGSGKGVLLFLALLAFGGVGMYVWRSQHG